MNLALDLQKIQISPIAMKNQIISGLKSPELKI